MKQQCENESIKENRGDIKFEIARLQSIIIDSMKRPPLVLSIFLQTMLLLYIFRAPFSYLDTFLTNPKWGYIPIFNYLNPAYYLIYTGSTTFTCILILVLILITMHIIGVVLLILISRKRSISKLIAKIMKVKLELYSTILFPFFVKTISTIFHCNAPNVSTQQIYTQFNCVYNGPNWLMWFSVVMFFVFLLILLLQSYLKFEFYRVSSRSSLIRKSQQWIPLVLVFHLFIECIAVFQSSLILLLIMNIIAIGMIAHLLFMDETLTLISTKINAGISLSLIYLIVFIDLNYLVSFPIPYIFWYGVMAFTLTTCIMYPNISIRYQLTNINKWNSATDRIQYCAGLRRLLSEQQHTVQQAMLQGYTDFHFQKCQMAGCPYKLSKEGINRIRIFREDKNLKDSDIKMQELIMKIYSQGIKYFPNIPTLNIQFSIFLYQHQMKQRSLKHLLSSSIQNISLEEYYKFYRLRKVLHEQLIGNSETTLDLLTEMQMRDLEQQFLRSIQKASLSDMELWSVLLDEHPDFGKLDQVGNQRISMGEEVKRLYTRITEKGNSQRITSLYVEYLINVCKQVGNFIEVQQKVKKSFSLDSRIMVFDWANSSQPSLVISGEQKSFGQIQDLNLSASLLFGYQKSQLMNRKLSFIMPQQLSYAAEQLISLKDTGKYFYLTRKDKYMIMVKKNIYISSSILKGSIFICTFQPLPVNPYSCKMLIQQKSPFNIIGMESKTISFFGIQAKLTDELIPLNQISEYLHQTLEKGSFKPKDVTLQNLLSFNILRRIKPLDSELIQEFSIKIVPIYDNFIELQFVKKKVPLPPRQPKPRVNQFKFEPLLSDGYLYYSNNIVPNFKYVSQKIQIDSGYFEDDKNGFTDYGKGIRTVRLLDNEVQIIEDSSSEASSKEQTQVVNPVAIGNLIYNPVGVQKEILENRESVKQFVQNHSPSQITKTLLSIGTIVSIGLFLTVCFVYRQNHNGIIVDLNKYADQNMKIGQIQMLTVLATRVSLLQQNKSTVDYVSLKQEIISSLSRLQQLKNLGHLYYIDTVMLDGTAQSLTNLQFIDALTSNIQQFVSALQSLPKLYASTLPIQFCLQNQKLIYPQMTQYVTNWDHFMQSSFNSSIIIQTVLMALFTIVQILFFSYVSYRIYKMFNDKISVLKIFLEISEQNVRIMSIKTEQFLNTLYNNETDIDDEETIIKKTNNKHTFAIKKKFKIIKREKLIYFMFGILGLIIISIILSNYIISTKNLLFMQDTLSFLNSTSSGKSFFYHSLHSIQLNVFNGSQNPTPAYYYITFYRNMINTYYMSFSGIEQFVSFWTSIMLDDICNGPVKIQNGCLLPSSKNGGMALITQLVLGTIAITVFQNDFSAGYYAYYKIYGSLHKSMTSQVLGAFSITVEQMKNVLIILLVVGVVIAPLLFMILGTNLMQKYTDKIDQTRKMLILLPINYLRNCESINQYLTQTTNRKNWICC